MSEHHNDRAGQGIQNEFKFIVEDGRRVPYANSYVSVEEADTYISANFHAYPMWQALDLLTQQQLLVWATRHLDSRAEWKGVLSSIWDSDPAGTNYVAEWAVPNDRGRVFEQSLRWPRANVEDIDGYRIPSNIIPKVLKQATAEMARYLIQFDRTVERPQDFLTELKASDVTLRFRDAVLAHVPQEVAYILRGIGYIASGRTNFSKINKV